MGKLTFEIKRVRTEPLQEFQIDVRAPGAPPGSSESRLPIERLRVTDSTLCALCYADCIDRCSPPIPRGDLYADTCITAYVDVMDELRLFIYGKTGEDVLPWCPFGVEQTNKKSGSEILGTFDPPPGCDS
jgi:hypothetical protein